MRYVIDHATVKKLALYFKDPGTQQLIDVAEEVDPQAQMVESILEKYGAFEKAALYITGIAAISYMLSVKGEEHWMIAAQQASSDPAVDLLKFASFSPSVNFNRGARLKRIERLLGYEHFFYSRISQYLADLNMLRSDLASILKADKDAKTVVFAVKMFYYSARKAGINVKVPLEIPLPVDRRICLISLLSGIIKGGAPTLRDARTLLMNASGLVRQAWDTVGRESGIPPLRIDALLWLLGGCYEKKRGAEQALEIASSMLSPKSPRAFLALRLLLGLK
ncbi:MAG: N-glycosylase/DNA lyase [Thermofilaceae archaeon]